MKKILLVTLIFCFCAFSSTYAQYSVGGEFSFHKFLGNGDQFPYGGVKDFPSMLGGGLRVGYTLDGLTRVNGSFTYTKSTPESIIYGNVLTTSNIEVEIRINRYLLGSTASKAGLYGVFGLGCGNFATKWDVNYTPGGEDIYFKDSDILLVHAAAALGLEVGIGPVILYAEGMLDYNLNHFVDKTTIKEINARHFMRIASGIRVPIDSKNRRGRW